MSGDWEELKKRYGIEDGETKTATSDDWEILKKRYGIGYTTPPADAGAPSQKGPVLTSALLPGTAAALGGVSAALNGIRQQNAEVSRRGAAGMMARETNPLGYAQYLQANELMERAAANAAEQQRAKTAVKYPSAYKGLGKAIKDAPGLIWNSLLDTGATAVKSLPISSVEQMAIDTLNNKNNMYVPEWTPAVDEAVRLQREAPPPQGADVSLNVPAGTGNAHSRGVAAGKSGLDLMINRELKRALPDENSVLNAPRNRIAEINAAAGGAGPAARAVRGTAQGVGQMGAVMAANALTGGAGGLALIGTTAKTNAIEKAFSEGADAVDAMAYGNLVGAGEILVESLSGGIPTMGEGVIGRVMGNVMGRLPAGVVKALDALGEGGEAVLSDFLEPVFARLTYDKGAKLAGAEAILEDGIIEILTSAFMLGGEAAFNRAVSAARAVGEPAGFLNQKSVNTAQTANPSPVTDLGGAGTSPDGGTPRAASPTDGGAVSADVVREYDAAVDADVLRFVSEVSRGGGGRVGVGTVDDMHADVLRQLTGADYTGFKVGLTADALRHINNRHGANGTADHSMASADDIARMGYVIANFDAAALVDESKAYKNADNSKAPIILLEKRIDGHYYVAEAVPNTAKKTIYVQSAYRNRDLAGAAWQKALGHNVQNAPANVPVNANNIPQPAGDVNTENSREQVLRKLTDAFIADPGLDPTQGRPVSIDQLALIDEARRRAAATDNREQITDNRYGRGAANGETTPARSA
ncbi:MAG: hypothetical protein LBK23_04905, partial [Oscillospiraceae bacterium]|nr:hypothetical protein [Oscillospiraceae bacterium]